MKNTPTKLTIAATAAVAIIAGALGASKAEAASSSTMIQLSHRLEEGAASLNKEFRLHFAHTSEFNHLVSDANQIAAKAKHIHGLAHDCTASLRHIEADIVSLDKLVHHLHEVVDRVESGRYGHTHGDTRHVHSLVSSINSTLHSMKRVVESLRRPSCGFSSNSCTTGSTYSRGRTYSRGNTYSRGSTYSRGRSYGRSSSSNSRYGRGGYASTSFRRW